MRMIMSKEIITITGTILMMTVVFHHVARHFVFIVTYTALPTLLIIISQKPPQMQWIKVGGGNSYITLVLSWAVMGGGKSWVTVHAVDLFQ